MGGQWNEEGNDWKIRQLESKIYEFNRKHYPNIFWKNNIIPINQIVQTDDNLIITINHQKDTYQPISTINIRTDTEEQWCFKTPENAAYVSITYSYAISGGPENVTLTQMDYFVDVSPCPLEADPGDPDRYIIDNIDDIIWLGERTQSEGLGEGKTFFLTTDLDLKRYSLMKSVKLPARSTFDGNGHTIKKLNIILYFFVYNNSFSI